MLEAAVAADAALGSVLFVAVVAAVVAAVAAILVAAEAADIALFCQYYHHHIAQRCAINCMSHKAQAHEMKRSLHTTVDICTYPALFPPNEGSLVEVPR